MDRYEFAQRSDEEHHEHARDLGDRDQHLHEDFVAREVQGELDAREYNSEDLSTRDYEDVEARDPDGHVIETKNFEGVDAREHNEELDARDFDDIETRDLDGLLETREYQDDALEARNHEDDLGAREFEDGIETRELATEDDFAVRDVEDILEARDYDDSLESREVNDETLEARDPSTPADLDARGEIAE